MAKRRKGTEKDAPEGIGPRTCGTMDLHRWLARKYPDYRWRRRQIESEVNEWIANYRGGGLRLGIVRVPVVVHVVYRTAAQNISDAQIRSQLDVLNADYRRLNADAGQVPAAFAPVAADTRIEFALAVRDPNCAATTGITRTRTTVTGFTFATKNNMKSAATGGADPWPNDRYLNIWVCHFTDGTLGYATYPGAPASVDGVVIQHSAFGTIGTVASPFDLGRTATHEIGHWLNLYHLWGDDDNSGVACARSDGVADTPTQLGENIGCPAFPHITCGNGPNGDMFMNYMDYTDDACMFMFSAGQVDRMNATLSVARASILASDGLIPPAGGAAPDLWCQDSADDDGSEPDPSAGPMYRSDDIWVRRSNDGLMNNDHQNPAYLGPGTYNFVYVRVRNRGCPSAGAQSGTLRLYWAKASPSLSWPVPWDGSVTAPALMGGQIGSQAVSVTGGDDEIYTFQWPVPNPADYAGIGADQGHFCLLARIETSATAPYGMTFPETSSLHTNVRNNNNIAWKNITVVNEQAGGGRFASFVMTSFITDRSLATLVFRVPEDEKRSLFDWGHVVLGFGERLHREWLRAGSKSTGVELRADRCIAIAKSGATLNGLPLASGVVDAVHLHFIASGRANPGAAVFALDAVQLDENEQVVGGQRFYLKTGPRPGECDWDRQIGLFDGVSWKSNRRSCC